MSHAGATSGDQGRDGEGLTVAATCLAEICSDHDLALSLLSMEEELTKTVQTLK